jgi:nucleoside-diphosphate-sugar epimerase
MNVLVLGGTRFIGPHVVRQLVAAGHETALFNRGQSRPDISLPQGVRVITGDRARLADYRESFKAFAPDVVIDLFPYTEAEAQAVMTVFDGIAGRLVAVSSCDVYRAFGRVNRLEDGPVEEGPIHEDSPLRTKLYPYRGIREDLPDYEKILVERVVTGQPHLPGTVLRLPMVYGPGDYRHRMYPYLKRMLDGRRFIVLEEGLAQWRWTRGYVEDVAAAIVLAAEDDRAAGQIYNVGEPESLSMREWILRIAEEVGWEGGIVTAPAAQLPPSLILDIETRQHIDLDTTKIRNQLGYAEQVTPAEAIRRTVAWESVHPPVDVPPGLFDYAAEDELLTRMRTR